MRYGLVACGSKGNGRTVELDLIGPFQPCDSMILLNYYIFMPREVVESLSLSVFKRCLDEELQDMV